jgi:hypothetical protein
MIINVPVIELEGVRMPQYDSEFLVISDNGDTMDIKVSENEQEKIKILEQQLKQTNEDMNMFMDFVLSGGM